MHLEAGALKVKWLIAKKGSIALEASMGTKRAPTTQHRHTERVQWNTYHNPYLPIRGISGVGAKPTDITGCEQRWSAKISKAKQSWNMQSHVSLSKPSGHSAQTCLPGAQPLTH